MEKHLSIKNRLVRSLFFILSMLALITLSIKHFSSTASIDEFIILPVLAVGFFYISIVNKIDVWINEHNLIYKWLSINKREIRLDTIEEVDIKKYKIIIRTQGKDYKLDIFNAGRRNRNLIIDFFKENINAPITEQVE